MKKTRFLCAITAFAMLTLTACNPLTFFTSNVDESSANDSQSYSSQEESIPSLPPAQSTALINSLDKLNYYAARKTINDHLANKAVNKSGWGTLYSGEAAVDSADDEDVPPPDSAYGEDVSELPPQIDSEESPTDSTNDRPQDTDTKFYYDLYDFGAFTVKRTIYFQIELTDENAFLGKNLGTGIVEVAISMGDIYDDLNMITFRNSDKFFSCMYHGYYGKNWDTHADKFSFAAYRYIEGFYYVKDLEYEHYEFYIEASPVHDAVFTCDYRNTGFENEPVPVVENSTYYIEKEVSYTIEELEEYFNPSVTTDSVDSLAA